MSENTKPSPSGGALALIVVGALTMVAATVCLLVLHEPAWRFGVAGGGLVQFAGWLLHGRRLRRIGGAA
ncbi:hypothetical protein OG302_14845 [Streptomyces sp. NBC_01283]|uniref:hypothetical protein n=1 Tax=Streptomyces sp. NBC_01283 TaxID=2903812 RepID=UPI00352C6C30|nr:hypothetical protein OG302_14845 [Streptomyces sp. NBC_01283]